MSDFVIEQMTPIRVLHRRTWATRSRIIHEMRLEKLQIGEFESLKSEYLDRVFCLILTTEAGTYIKEFVHGDFGRTKPSLTSILGGDCEADLMELDVMEVHLDWPPELCDKLVNANTDSECGSPAKTLEMGNNMNGSPEALADLYSKGCKLMNDAEAKPRGDDRQNSYIQARRCFEKASDLVESLSLFSDNETIEDIATNDFKYLLIPAHLAKITTSAECGPHRLQTFTRAETYILQFLRKLRDYNFGDAAVDRALSISASNPINSDFCTFKGAPSTTSLEIAVRQRNEKIERYKKVKQLEEKLAELERGLVAGDQVDDEVAREYNINLIEKILSESLASLDNEVRPAILIERSRSGDLPSPSGPNASSSKRTDGLACTVTIVKDHIQKQVFGLGYPGKPTVTVDEFITKKLNDGDLVFDKHSEIYANSLQRYAEQPNLRRQQEEVSDEEHDTKEDRHDEEELKRKREWDEFKDDHPRGSGNRHNMG